MARAMGTVDVARLGDVVATVAVTAAMTAMNSHDCNGWLLLPPPLVKTGLEEKKLVRVCGRHSRHPTVCRH